MYIQHYVFMTADYYVSLSGKPAERRALFITGMNSDDTHQLQDDLLNEPLISGISFYDETLQNFSTMVKSLDLIVWTLIISSMALAFVVLGNLIRINVAERQREIATLKVLGFRRKEVQSYIFKENNILTIAGAIAGLPLGNVLALDGVFHIEGSRRCRTQLGCMTDLHPGEPIIAVILAAAFDHHMQRRILVLSRADIVSLVDFPARREIHRQVQDVLRQHRGNQQRQQQRQRQSSFHKTQEKVSTFRDIFILYIISESPNDVNRLGNI
jgi:hypothetical protein